MSNPKMKIYVAGPMTNNPRWPEEFAFGKKIVSEAGHIPVTPVDIDEAFGYRFDGAELFGDHDHHALARRFMRINTEAVIGCDGIVMLAGWKTSKGSIHELIMADRLGLEKFAIHNEKLTPMEIRFTPEWTVLAPVVPPEPHYRIVFGTE